MTAWTSEDTNIQGHGLSMSTGATGLTRVGRVHFDKLSPSFFRFARQFAEELRPRGIGNAFGKAMVMGHTINVQVFHANRTETVYDLPRLLVSEVVTPELDTLMYPRDNLAVFSPFRRALRKLTMLALHLCQGFLFLPEKAGMSNLLSIGESSKGLQADVNAHLSSNRFKPLRLTLATKRDVPLAGRGTVHRTRFDFAFHRTVVDHLDAANLGEAYTFIVRHTKAALREGETIISALAFEARIAGVLGMFSDSTKEGLESLINTHGH